MNKLSFTAKCDDRFYCSILIDGKEFETDGYVPDIGLGKGDYIKLEIDIDNGTIIGWNPKLVREYVSRTED